MIVLILWLAQYLVKFPFFIFRTCRLEKEQYWEREQRARVFEVIFWNLAKFTKNIAKNQSHGVKYYFSFIFITKYLKLSMDFTYVPNGFHRKSSMNFDISDLVCIKYLTLCEIKEWCAKIQMRFYMDFYRAPFYI